MDSDAILGEGLLFFPSSSSSDVKRQSFVALTDRAAPSVWMWGRG